jgi:uncharacterized protein (DUF362 family)
MGKGTTMSREVALLKTEYSDKGIEKTINKILDLIHFKKDEVNQIIIKPNLCYYWKTSTGYTTDPRIVSGIIKNMRNIYGKEVDIKIVESDASSMKTKYAFKILDYEKMAKKMNVELFNLSKDKIVEKNIKVGKYEATLRIPKTVLDTDLFVNVPKLKIMKETQITCALKNNFGCIATPKKIQYHKHLIETIIGVNKILHTDLVIVDGIIALGKKPANLNLIMGSSDIFNVDWVASQIFGYNPRNNPVIRLAVKEKLGDPKNIGLLGDSLKDFQNKIPMENPIVTKYTFPFLIKMLNLYAKIVGDVIPPIVEDL